MLFTYASSLIWVSISTLLGDLSIETLDNSGLSWSCQLRYYFFSMLLGGIYYSFCLQAFFRLTRVVYARLAWLQGVRFCHLSILAQWILSGLATTFLMIRIVYVPAEHSCIAPFTDVRALIYAMSIFYSAPIGTIFVIYQRITSYMKRAPVALHHHTTRRDILVVRRIVLLISGLLVLASPTLILWIMFLVTGNVHPLSYRLEFLVSALGAAVLSSTTLFITPQLRAVVLKKRDRGSTHRTDLVAPIRNGTQRF
jgi:hypothetical protein